MDVGGCRWIWVDFPTFRTQAFRFQPTPAIPGRTDSNDMRNPKDPTGLREQTWIHGPFRKMNSPTWDSKCLINAAPLPELHGWPLNTADANFWRKHIHENKTETSIKHNYLRPTTLILSYLPFTNFHRSPKSVSQSSYHLHNCPTFTVSCKSTIWSCRRWSLVLLVKKWVPPFFLKFTNKKAILLQNEQQNMIIKSSQKFIVMAFVARP